MRINKILTILFILAAISVAGCGINSVTRAEIEAVKPGSVITYRYQKDGKSWFYADKVTRIEGDTIYYNPSSKESTAGNDERLRTFDVGRELSIKKADLLKYETEQGEERKVVIWIE